MTALISTAKTNRKAIRKIELKTDSACTLLPWTHDELNARSEIKAYVMASGKVETIATINQTGAIDTGKIANFITKSVNQHSEIKKLAVSLANALEMCCSKNELDWKIQHKANVALAQARELGLFPLMQEAG